MTTCNYSLPCNDSQSLEMLDFAIKETNIAKIGYISSKINKKLQDLFVEVIPLQVVKLLMYKSC